MARLTNPITILVLPLALCASLGAQESKWTPSFKFSTGLVEGGAKKLFLPSNTSGSVAPIFGGAVEVAYQLDKQSAVVFDLGINFLPGDNGIVSYIELPTTARTPAWVVGDTYTAETRDRKVDGQSWQASALYRRDTPIEGLFWQAGLRIGFNKTTQRDTGASTVYRVTAVSGTGVPTFGAINSSSAIASVDEKKTTAIGLLAGLGYRFDERYSGAANVYQTKFEGAAAGKKSGTVFELSFGVRF